MHRDAGGEPSLGTARAGRTDDMFGRYPVVRKIVAQFCAGGDITPDTDAIAGTRRNHKRRFAPRAQLRRRIGEQTVEMLLVNSGRKLVHVGTSEIVEQ